MKKRKFRVRFFLKAKFTHFGLYGCAHGMYSGGYNYWVYGITYILNIEYLVAWGDFYDMQLQNN